MSSVGENILCIPGSEWMNIFRCQVSVKTFCVFQVRSDEHLSMSSVGENIWCIPGSEWMNIFLCQVSVKTFCILQVRSG